MSTRITHGGVFHQLDAKVVEKLGTGCRPVFVPSTDHNPDHLYNAFQRDEQFMKNFLERLQKNDGRAQRAMVVQYERDIQIFSASCRNNGTRKGNYIVQGEQYVALVQVGRMSLCVGRATKSYRALMVTLFRNPEKT